MKSQGSSFDARLPLIELLRRCHEEGSPSAQRAFHRRLYPRLVKQLRRRVRSRADAEERAQDIINELLTLRWEERPGDQERQLNAWIARAVHFEALDAHTKASTAKRRAVHSTDQLDRFDRFDPSTTDGEAERALRERVAGLLQQLKPSDRELLERYFYEGRSRRELAEEDGIPLSRVKDRLHRVYARVRRLVAPHDPTRH